MIGTRLQRARKCAGFSQRALAEKVGLTNTAISQFEKDERTPSSKTLLALADACGLRVEYFFRPVALSLERPEFRKRSSLGVGAQEQIEARILERAERLVELIEVFPERPVPSFEVPEGLPEVSTLDDVEAVADALRRVWCLGDDPIADLTATLEERGLLVITTPDPSGGRFDGLSAHIGALPVLVVGERWPGDRQRFTLAHELGHLILGDMLPAGINPERACDRFAGAFLAPQTAVRRALGARRHRLQPRELVALKAEFGLSMRAWIFRAVNLHIISEQIATTLHQHFTRNNWHRLEPGPALPSETPTLHSRLVLRALAEDLIGESKAAELCGMSGDQLEAWLSMEGGGAPPRL